MHQGSGRIRASDSNRVSSGRRAGPRVVLLLPPPQAACNIKPAKSMHENVAAASLAVLLLRSEPRPIPTHPRSGAQSAANSPKPALEDIMATLDAVVFTVSTAGVPGVTELGLTEHVGASAGVGVTAQVNTTEPLNPAGADRHLRLRWPKLRAYRRRREGGYGKREVQVKRCEDDSFGGAGYHAASARSGAPSYAPGREGGS